MKHLFKRAISSALAGVMALSAVSFASLTVSAETVTYDAAKHFGTSGSAATNKVITEENSSGEPKVFSIMEAYSIEGSTTVWANGGKANNAFNEAVDSKSIQYYLWERAVSWVPVEDPEVAGAMEQVRGDIYNSTNAKGIKWVAVPATTIVETTSGLKTTTVPTMPAYTAKSDTSVIKVSKGKITAVAPGYAWLWTLRQDQDKLAKDKKATDCYGYYTLVKVKSAPTVLTVSDGVKDTDKKALDAAIKATAVSIGDKVEIYIEGKDKNGNAADPSATYTIAVDAKSADYLQVLTDVGYTGITSSGEYTTTYSSEVVNSSAVYSKASSVTVVERDMNLIKDDKLVARAPAATLVGTDVNGAKVVKGKVTITNNQSGKKASLSVTVSNGVVSTTYPGYTANDTMYNATTNSTGANKGIVIGAATDKAAGTAKTIAATDYADFKVAGSDADYAVYTDKTGNSSNNTTVAVNSYTAKPTTLLTDVATVTAIKELPKSSNINKGKFDFKSITDTNVTVKYDKKQGGITIQTKKGATATSGYIAIAYNTNYEEAYLPNSSGVGTSILTKAAYEALSDTAKATKYTKIERFTGVILIPYRTAADTASAKITADGFDVVAGTDGKSFTFYDSAATSTGYSTSKAIVVKVSDIPENTTILVKGSTITSETDKTADISSKTYSFPSAACSGDMSYSVKITDKDDSTISTTYTITVKPGKKPASTT